MSDLIPGLLLYAAAFVVLVGIGLVWDVWRNKEMFDIAARSPLLLCLAGAAHVALVFLQMLAEIIDSSFPCTITIWASYVSFGTISTAYLLRAARLVVVYDKELRRKYMRLVKPAVQWKCMLAVLTACCVISLIVQLSFAALRQKSGNCHFFEDGYSVFLPITVLYLIAMAAMASRLKETNDAFKIRNEIGYICVVTAITVAIRTVHITLLKHSNWWSGSDETLPPTVHDLVACSAALYVSFYQPLQAFYGFGSGRSLRTLVSARQIFSGGHDDDGFVEGQSGWEEEDEASIMRKPEAWGVVEMLRSDTLRPLLVNFCEQNLCGESVDFLVDVAINYASLSDPAEQFAALSEIVETYLAPGSINEINVSNSYRNEAAAWLRKREEFLALEEEKRTHVLDRQHDEIVKMLSENLLVKFKQTSLAISAIRALKEMMAVEATGGEDGQDADMRSMIHASAAAEVARIQHISRAAPSPGASPFGLGAGLGVSRVGVEHAREDSFGDSDSMVSYTFDTTAS